MKTTEAPSGLVLTTEKPNSLRIVHQNIQGFSDKDLEISLFLNSENIDVLCVTEHWLENYELLLNLDNFKVVSSFSRKNAKRYRGGSLIILHNNIHYKERKDIVSLTIERHIELSCVELEQIIIVCAYSNFPRDRTFGP